MRGTLRRRLTVTAVGLVALVVAVMGVTSTLALRASLLRQVDERLVAAGQRAELARTRTTPAGALAGAATTAPRPATARDDEDDERPPWFDGPGQEVGTVNAVVSPAGTTSGYIGTDGGYYELDSDQLATLLAVPADGEVRTVALGDLGTYRAVATTADDGTVVTALPTAEADATVRRYVVIEAVVAAVGLMLAGAGANVLVRRDLRPLTRVAATAARVSELPLDKEARIGERVPDTDPATEVGRVGAALNRMLGHVEAALAARQESEQQVRRFVADASHELRTPLASIRGYTELVRRSGEELPAGAGQALARVESEAVRMTALVEDMLLLARLDAGRPLESESVDLAALAIDAVADAHAAGPDHEWRLDLVADDEGDGDPLTIVRGDDHRLRQVLANLLTNARLHTPAGTHVAVAVDRRGDDVVVSVDDDGPGIPPDLRDRLFERFARGDASRNRAVGSSSTGLGLAIAHAVVGAHGGTLTCTSRPGRTVFTVTLPAYSG